MSNWKIYYYEINSWKEGVTCLINFKKYLIITN